VNLLTGWFHDCSISPKGNELVDVFMVEPPKDLDFLFYLWNGIFILLQVALFNQLKSD
jgi:hypothetical protein